MQHRALEAVADMDVAVLDLRTLAPLDLEAIESIAKRTHRILVLTEAHRTFGPGAEIAAHLSERCFSWLDAPVMRLGSADTPTPAAPGLEAEFLPSVQKIKETVEKLVAY